MQHRQQQDRHGPVQVQVGPHPRIVQDRPRVTYVPRHGERAFVPGQQRAGVSQDEGITVHVDGACPRGDGMGDLVHILCSRQTGAEVEELVHPRSGQPGDRAGQERPVPPGPGDHPRRHLRHPRTGVTIGGEVVPAAQPVVIDPSGMGPACIQRPEPFPIPDLEISVKAGREGLLRRAVLLGGAESLVMTDVLVASGIGNSRQPGAGVAGHRCALVACSVLHRWWAGRAADLGEHPTPPVLPVSGAACGQAPRGPGCDATARVMRSSPQRSVRWPCCPTIAGLSLGSGGLRDRAGGIATVVVPPVERSRRSASDRPQRKR